MPLDLSNTLVVGIATTALFDMTESDSAFQAKFKSDRETAFAEYRAYALQHENDPWPTEPVCLLSALPLR